MNPRTFLRKYNSIKINKKINHVVKKRLFYPLRLVALCNFQRGVRAGGKLRYVENTPKAPKDRRYRIFRRECIWRPHTSRPYKCQAFVALIPALRVMTLCSVSCRIHQIESPIRTQSLTRAIYCVRYSICSKRAM